jgi:7-cyano-7-deazaguanine synthase in queuosine biosynthesis
MDQDSKPTIDPDQQTIKILLVRVMHMAETLKGYYDQHQAIGCTCAQCKEAERAFRRIGMESMP